ncbi:hypothetical protein EJB05_26728, partial [Eragrostis curvula]
MKITIQTSKIVKPAYVGDGCAPSANDGATDIVPLTVFDKVTFDEHISSMHFFRPPAPSNAAVELGLAKMLAEYRVWAGRRDAGRRAVVLTDAGARFVAATADVSLDSVISREPPTREVFSGLHPNGDGVEELMLVQVTRFACGGFAVGTTVWHPVTDGRAARSFMKAWGQATRGAAICPLPVHDRVSFFRPRDPPRVEFEHRGAEFTSRHGGFGDKKEHVVSNTDHSHDDKVATHRVRFTREMIAELKAQASSSSPANASSSRPYSTLQCVVAHLWRCITAARRLDAHTVTRARIAVNGRSRMRDPPVPEEYIGNVVLWAWPTTTAGELLSRPLGHAAELISRAVARVDDAYFRSFIDFASSGAVEAEGLAPTADPGKMVLCPDVQVDSLLGFPFQDLDFGGGPPFLYMPSHSMPAEGGMFLVPSFSGDGSVEAYVPLFSRNMETFKKCCYSEALLASSSLQGQLCGDPLCRQPSALGCSSMATSAGAADDDGGGQRQRPMAAVRLHMVSPTASLSSVAPQAWLGPSRSGHPRAGFGVPTATPSPPSASA